MMIQLLGNLNFRYLSIIIYLLMMEFGIIDEFQKTSLTVCIFHTIGFRISPLPMRKRNCVCTYLIVFLKMYGFTFKI